MQVQRGLILFNGLPVLGHGFRITSLGLEDFSGELVDTVRRRRAAVELVNRVVPRAHMQARCQIQNVGIAVITGLKTRKHGRRGIEIVLREMTLHEADSGEAGQVRVTRAFEFPRQVCDYLPAFAGCGPR